MLTYAGVYAQVGKLTQALQQLYAANVSSAQQQQQLASDLEIALEEGAEADALREALTEAQEQCAQLQEQVDAGESSHMLTYADVC
jgi:chromosome segregation ATPase